MWSICYPTKFCNIILKHAVSKTGVYGVTRITQFQKNIQVSILEGHVNSWDVTVMRTFLGCDSHAHISHDIVVAYVRPRSCDKRLSQYWNIHWLLFDFSVYNCTTYHLLTSNLGCRSTNRVAELAVNIIFTLTASPTLETQFYFEINGEWPFIIIMFNTTHRVLIVLLIIKLTLPLTIGNW